MDSMPHLPHFFVHDSLGPIRIQHIHNRERGRTLSQLLNMRLLRTKLGQPLTDAAQEVCCTWTPNNAGRCLKRGHQRTFSNMNYDDQQGWYYLWPFFVCPPGLGEPRKVLHSIVANVCFILSLSLESGTSLSASSTQLGGFPVFLLRVPKLATRMRLVRFFVTFSMA